MASDYPYAITLPTLTTGRCRAFKTENIMYLDLDDWNTRLNIRLKIIPAEDAIPDLLEYVEKCQPESEETQEQLETYYELLHEIEKIAARLADACNGFESLLDWCKPGNKSTKLDLVDLLESVWSDNQMALQNIQDLQRDAYAIMEKAKT